MNNCDLDGVIAALQNVVDVLSKYQRDLNEGFKRTEKLQRTMMQVWTDDNAKIFNDRVKDAGTQLYDLTTGVRGLEQQLDAIRCEAVGVRSFGANSL